MIRVISLIILLIMLSPDKLQASSEDKTIVSRRVAETITILNDYIQFMADKKMPLSKRKTYRDKALSLFIAHGEAYEENGMVKNGVTIETTSRYRKTPKHRLVRDYFTGLLNLKYPKVSVTSAQIADIKLSDLKKIGDTEDGTVYEGKCYIDQTFNGFRDGMAMYREMTKQTVRFRIIIDNPIDMDLCIVLLGDITAIEP